MTQMRYEYVAVSAEERDAELVAEIQRLWEASVRATHDFLDDKDIAALLPYVAEGVRMIPLFIYRARERRRDDGIHGRG